MEINIIHVCPPPDSTYFLPAFLVFFAPIGVFVLRRKLEELQGGARLGSFLLQFAAGLSAPFAAILAVYMVVAFAAGSLAVIALPFRAVFG